MDHALQSWPMSQSDRGLQKSNTVFAVLEEIILFCQVDVFTGLGMSDMGTAIRIFISIT